MWKREVGNSLLKLANIFASVLIVGQLANIAIPEIEVVWWVLVIGILSTLSLYLGGASFLKKIYD